MHPSIIVTSHILMDDDDGFLFCSEGSTTIFLIDRSMDVRANRPPTEQRREEGSHPSHRVVDASSLSIHFSSFLCMNILHIIHDPSTHHPCILCCEITNKKIK